MTNNPVKRDERAKEKFSLMKNFLKEFEVPTTKEWENTLKKEINEKAYPALSKSVVKSVIEICEYWKPYLASEEDFYELVREKILSMYCIQTAVISSHPELKSFVGRKCGLNEKPLPYCVTIWVKKSGTKIIRDGFGSLEKIYVPK